MDHQLALISHEIENTQIHQRSTDGYVNATAMCRAAGKLFGHYNALQTTREFLSELSSVIGIPITNLVITIQGGKPELQGTWVHPDVAVNLGQWCSPKFAVAVSRSVRDWMSGKAKPTMPYHMERYLMNNAKIPAGHFCMLAEMAILLIGPLEREGYTLPDEMVPDISSGQLFCRWLRDVKGVRTADLPTFLNEYPDGRVVKSKLYPESLLIDFRIYFREDWMPKRSRSYFRKRSPEALPFLDKILALPPASQPVGVKSAFLQIKESVQNVPSQQVASPESARSHFARMRAALDLPPSPPNPPA